MTGRHRRDHRVPRWIGLMIMALFVIVFSAMLAPMIASADIYPR